MDSGWYGGMTQGLGMSFLVRMLWDIVTGNQSYKDAALNSTQLLSINVSDGGVYGIIKIIRGTKNILHQMQALLY